AFTFMDNNNSFAGGVEYRDTGYRSAPDNEFVSQVEAVNFETDSFYNAAPTEPTGSTFSCTSARPTITVAVNMAADGMDEIRNTCETEHFEGGQFCATDSLDAVRDAFFSACEPPH